MKTSIIALLLFIGALTSSIAQNLQEGQKRWSPESQLTADDFRIKISDENADPFTASL